MAVIAIAGFILWQLAEHQAVELRSGEPVLREFMAFYAAGYLLNESPELLYNPNAFLKTYHALFPRVPPSKRPLYAHAPFEAVVFQPFARVPYEQALVAWQALSLAVFCAGFTLVWLSTKSLPRNLLPVALVLAASFQPVAVASILFGQVSALTFFWIAVAIWCQRREWDYGSGAALAMCLSKPTLLILLLPMLVIGWRLRMLVGFIGGGALLAVASLFLVGWQGCLDYAGMILHFGGQATAEGHQFAPMSRYVDLNSFVKMLTGGRGQMALVVLAVVAAGVVPCLARLWRCAVRGGEVELSLAWASTLTWTMLLNLYAPTYDTPVIMLGILLMVDSLCRADQRRLPLVPQLLFVLLYAVPWIPVVPMGGGKTLQLYTVVLIALGLYQVWLGMRGARGNVNQGRGISRGLEPLAAPRAG